MATESNRDKARRGGWGTGEVLSVGFNVSLGGVPDPVSGAKPGETVTARSAPNALTTRHTVLMIDPAMFSDPAKGERFALEGGTLFLYVGRARFALAISAGDTERTICENARCLLAAAGLDQHVRIQWREQEQSASDSGPLQRGREVADHAEMARTFGASQDGDGPEVPTPAPGQVWLPPPSASGHPLGWVDIDGTVTIADSPATAHDGLLRLTRGGTVSPEALGGWTCIGVATPHGRVMVGDGFSGSDRDGAGPVTVVGVVAGVLLSVVANNGLPMNKMADVLVGRTRTRYAPARAGERYRHRRSGKMIACVKPGTQLAAGEHAVIEGAWADPAQWERIDPGQCKQNATRLKIDVSSDPLPELSWSVAPQPHTVIVRDGAPATLHLAAPARDLRALADAIGRALESAAPEIVTFDGQPLSVLRSDGCAEPSVHGGAIDANARDLCVFRASVAQALAVGRSCICQWGKERTLTVERVGGPLVTAQHAPAEPAATHYDGAQGGPDAWRWEVAE